jgi:uroporphyrinogen decarboxylase
MARIPESIKQRILHPTPDVERFLSVITGQKDTNRALLVELVPDPKTIRWVTENILEKNWIPESTDPKQMEQHLLGQIDFWYRMGYDFMPMIGGLEFSVPASQHGQITRPMHGARGLTSVRPGPIQTPDDFDRYPWPEVTDEMLWKYHFVAEHLPDGMGLMVCPTGGFLEIPLNVLIGYEPLTMMVYDKPALVSAVFERVRKLIIETYRRLIDIPQVVGFFQCDHMGFRSGTLLSPKFLKTHVLTGHKKLVEMAHAHDKVYFLNSSGNLDPIMDYLIDDIEIDARHAYEDAIMPVESFYGIYGKRLGVLGGLDLKLLTNPDEQAVRTRIKNILDRCISHRRYALGSGSTLDLSNNPENLLAFFDEAFRWGR